MSIDLWPRRLMVFMVLLLGACLPPATLPTTSVTEPAATASTELTAPSVPSSIVEESTYPALTVSERQETQLRRLIVGILNNAGYIPQDQFDHLAGLLLVADMIFPNYMKDVLESFSLREDLSGRVQPLLDYMDSLTSREKEQLIAATIQDYHLTVGEDGAVLINLDSSFATAEYDGSTGVTKLIIPISHQDEISMAAENYHDFLVVRARTLNPEALEEEATELSVSSLVLQPSAIPPYNQQLRLELQGNMLGWSEILFQPGLFIDGSGDILFARFIHLHGLRVADVVMSLRPFRASNHELFHPNLYGGVDPQPLPALTGSELENAMATDLQEALELAVLDESITRERANELRERFDDEDLVAVAPSPVFRAAVLIAASIPDVGGDFILDVLLGENGTGHPIPLYFNDDQALVSIFGEAGEPIPDVSNKLGELFFHPRKEGTYFLILNESFDHGREPVEAIAAFMPHEIIVHESAGVSRDEEVLGHLLQPLSWAKLVERDPSLVAQKTFLTQFHNTLLFMLMNTVYRDQTGSYVGILSHGVDLDWNVAPKSERYSFKSFMELMENDLLVDRVLDSSAPGGKNIEQLLLAMFGDDPVVEEKAVAQTFGGTFSLYLDSHTRFYLNNERAVDLARLLELEIESGN